MFNLYLRLNGPGEVALYGAADGRGERAVLGIGLADDGLLQGKAHRDAARLGGVCLAFAARFRVVFFFSGHVIEYD